MNWGFLCHKKFKLFVEFKCNLILEDLIDQNENDIGTKVVLNF
jgi:hypothetical protein